MLFLAPVSRWWDGGQLIGGVHGTQFILKLYSNMCALQGCEVIYKMNTGYSIWIEICRHKIMYRYIEYGFEKKKKKKSVISIIMSCMSLFAICLIVHY